MVGFVYPLVPSEVKRPGKPKSWLQGKVLMCLGFLTKGSYLAHLEGEMVKHPVIVIPSSFVDFEDSEPQLILGE